MLLPDALKLRAPVGGGCRGLGRGLMMMPLAVLAADKTLVGSELPEFAFGLTSDGKGWCGRYGLGKRRAWFLCSPLPFDTGLMGSWITGMACVFSQREREGIYTYLITKWPALPRSLGVVLSQLLISTQRLFAFGSLGGRGP
jgi:hypothetical protein